jgi:hypothetical protein
VSKQQNDTINNFDNKKVFSAAVPKCKKVSDSPGHIFMRPIQKYISHSNGDVSIAGKKVQNFPIKKMRLLFLQSCFVLIILRRSRLVPLN